MEDNKKKGLGMVLEGGGMRGLYTAGVLDELMEQGIYADSTVGVSAGAIFGCNYKSRQIGRTLRYNTRFCKDKRYMGLKSWITTGDLYSKDFAYGEVPWKLDVFDTETFARSPMKFTVVCTDIETVILPTNTKYSFVSSSLIKEVLHFNAEIKNLVPACVLRELSKKNNKKDK